MRKPNFHTDVLDFKSDALVYKKELRSIQLLTFDKLKF